MPVEGSECCLLGFQQTSWCSFSQHHYKLYWGALRAAQWGWWETGWPVKLKEWPMVWNLPGSKVWKVCLRRQYWDWCYSVFSWVMQRKRQNKLSTITEKQTYWRELLTCKRYHPEGPWQTERVSRQKPPESHPKAARDSCIWDRLALYKTLAEYQLERKTDLEISGESWWTRNGIQVSIAKQHNYFIHQRMLQILKSESSYWSMTMNLDKPWSNKMEHDMWFI